MSIDRGQNRDLLPIAVRDRSFIWGKRTYLMGILNVTPDSFSDGGLFHHPESAIAQARYLVKAGADILDIGGESTRPGAAEISPEEELNRVVPVIEAIRRELSVPISVDTTKAAIASASVAAGADIINDISGATFDSQMLPTVAELGVPIVLMHMRGTPKTMQTMTDYQDLIGEIYQFLQARVEAAIASGIDKSCIILDPGIGFAKTYDQNLEILRRLSEFRSLDCPILIGVSRKSFIGRILNQTDPQGRVWGTAGACAGAIASGADILRVHDLPEMRDVSLVADAIFRGCD
ncbi:MAG TPA: dihydropteroate synthase [Cyanobacteria bacterium UBA11369]|nr:dihydropteroate synthase [Cyanobacteria bacterium UBA11371]HBE34110.1 dihydropteroate synthase [Cyanobacteria bacterium UBA11368]HBE47694.1 dihydropteroate synthase [Cyanobacteria bacterium UBA11369]